MFGMNGDRGTNPVAGANWLIRKIMGNMDTSNRGIAAALQGAQSNNTGYPGLGVWAPGREPGPTTNPYVQMLLGNDYESPSRVPINTRPEPPSVERYSRSEFDPINLPQFNPEAYRGMAQGLVNRQFNPIIQAILADQASTKTRAKSNQRDVGSMYQQLAAYTNQSAATNQKQQAQVAAQTRGAYEDQRDNIAAMYANAEAQQRQEAAQLGMGSFGTAEAAQQLNADELAAQTSNTGEQQATTDAFRMIQQGSADYDRAASRGAVAEGAESQKDIISQLEDYLSKSQTNLSQVQGQKAGSMSELMMQLAQAGYNRDSENAKFQYQQQRDTIGDENTALDFDMKMQQLLQGQQQSNQPQEQRLNPLQQVGQFAEGMTPGKGNAAVGQLLEALRDPRIASGDTDSNTPGQQPLTPEMFAEIVAGTNVGSQVPVPVMKLIALEYFRQFHGR